MNSIRASALRRRIGFAVVGVFLVWAFANQNTQTSRALEAMKKKVEAAEQSAESILVKLKVVYEHKLKVTELYNQFRNASERKNEELKTTIRKCELNSLSMKERLTKCEDDLTKRPALVPQGDANAEDSLSAVAKLQERLATLEGRVREATAQLEASEREKSSLQAQLDECQRHAAANAGVAPKPYYVKNDSVHFERSHRAGAKLEFARDEAAGEEPLKDVQLLRGADLVKKLAERNAQRARENEEGDVHPAERKEQDEYVAEQPDKDEKDYREA